MTRLADLQVEDLALLALAIAIGVILGLVFYANLPNLDHLIDDAACYQSLAENPKTGGLNGTGYC